MSEHIGYTMLLISFAFLVGGLFMIFDKAPDTQILIGNSTVALGGKDLTIERKGKWLMIGTRENAK